MASTGLRRTLSGNGNQNTATFSVWVKRTSTANDARIYTSWYDANNQGWITFSNNTIGFFIYQSGSYSVQVRTNRVFRDTNAWYHVLFAIDTTQGTAADRVKIYINGTQETSMAQTDYPNSNQSLPFGLSSYNQRIGERSGDDYFDGCMSHFHFVDGTAYTPSTFGETDATTGEWKIKADPGLSQANYGSNGFFILKDSASVTDQSGNSNNWTVNSGSLTNTQDCPSNIFAVFNAISKSSDYNGQNAPVNGATTFVSGETSTNYPVYFSTLGMTSGKYYFECKMGSSGGGGAMIGISDQQKLGSYFGSGSYDYGYFGYDGKKYVQGTSGATYGSSYGNNDIVGCAVDLDNNKLYFHKNGTYQNSGVPTSGSTGTGAISIAAASATTTGFYFFTAGDSGDSDAPTVNANFGNGFFGTTAISSEGANASGNGKFEYDVPTGYTALCTKGLNT